MSARTGTDDPGARATRLTTVALVWLAGLGTGLYGLLGASARYGCAAGDRALACRGTGSALGIAVVVVAVLVVTIVTLVSRARPPQQVVVLGLGALVLLGVCAYLARSLAHSA